MKLRDPRAPRLLWSMGIALLGLGVFHLSQATSVRLMGMDEMAARADHVVLARAASNRVETDPETLYHHTITEFEVIEDAKGDLLPGETVVVQILGGEAPGSGYATTLADAPRFTAGESVILFTSPRADGRKNLVGFFLGAIRLAEDSKSLAGDPGTLMVLGGPPESLAPGAQIIVQAPTSFHRHGSPAPTVSAPEPGAAAAAASASGAPGAGAPATRRASDFLGRIRQLVTVQASGEEGR